MTSRLLSVAVALAVYGPAFFGPGWLGIASAFAQTRIAPTAPAVAAPASQACTLFDAAEAEGKAQVARRIAAIDEAADTGNVETFCAATGDLVFVYRSMRDGAAACSAGRATRWADALARTTAALAGTCR